MASISLAEILLSVLFSFLIVIDITGNVLVCLVVYRSKQMRRPMNYLLVNLAVADIVIGLFMLPRHVFHHAFHHPTGLHMWMLVEFQASISSRLILTKISEFLYTSSSKRVLVLILSYENEISFTCKIHFHMNGCTPGLALMERLGWTRRWAIVFSQDLAKAQDKKAKTDVYFVVQQIS